jgi:two-component system sensor histidine kinase HydH
MRILPLKKLYLPALSIVAVVLLFLVIISISTYRNLDREKDMALTSLNRQGISILRSLEASARAWGMLPMWQEDSIANLIQETGKNEDIQYIYLIDSQGNVVHHSDPAIEGGPPSWNPQMNKEVDQIITRIRDSSNGAQVYEFAKIFSPITQPSGMHQAGGMKGHGHLVKPHFHRGETIILGLRMIAYEQARKADLLHAFIMAAILLILGTAAIFFIFVIQNYYLVDRTLKQTKDYARQVLASMANGLISIDIKGRIISYNSLALDLLDLEEAEAQNKDFPDVIDIHDSAIQQTLQHCVPVIEREIKYEQKSGKTIPMALSATPIKNEDNECEGAVIVLRDLSEIKQLEEKVRRSEKLAAIGKLAAGVAHEIRNPLSSIRGFAQFLKHALKDMPRDRQYAETMVSEVDRINKVVTDLLTFARPMEADLKPTNVTELIEHAVRLVEADAKFQALDIRMNIPVLPEFKMDVNQMTQALLNLLLNSLQSVKQGGYIEVGAELNSHSGLQLWIEDDGPGIAEDKIQRIFEPFFTTRETGSGLGLSIVHKIVENHNGEIRVQSPPSGKKYGSRFTIIIP